MFSSVILDSFKTLDFMPTKIHVFLVLSIVLSLPTIIVGEKILFALPVLVIIMLSFVFGERFIVAIIIISLFTLVGDLNRSLRTVVQLVDITLLSILFLKRFGLNFQSYPKIPKSVLYFLLLYFFFICCFYSFHTILILYLYLANTWVILG